MNVWLTQVSLFLSNQCVQVSEGLCVIDGTVDGLSPGLHGLNIHELGDLSQGCSRLEYYSLRKQATFCHATTSFPTKWCPRKEHRNSVLMTYHYPDLGNASDWLKQFLAWHNQSEAHAIYFDVIFKNGNDFLSNIIDNNGVKKENIPVSFNSPQYPFKPMLCPQNSLVPLHVIISILEYSYTCRCKNCAVTSQDMGYRQCFYM